MASVLETTYESGVLRDYPKPQVRHCHNIDDVGSSELRHELRVIEAYCQRHSIPMVVEIEQLCLANPDHDQGTQSFYRIPEGQKHRLVQSSTGLAYHYQWLCFSTPASTPPPFALGLSGDIWVRTTSKSQRIFCRGAEGWHKLVESDRLLPEPEWLRHPFAPDLCFSFGVHKLGWFPMELTQSVFPALWKARGGMYPYQHVSLQAMVKALYETTGKPLDYNHGEPPSSTVVAHSCTEQSRASKQWHAERVRVSLLNVKKPSENSGASQESSPGQSQVDLQRPASGDDSVASPVPVADTPRNDHRAGNTEALPTWIPLVDDSAVVLRLGDNLRKVELPRLKKYAHHLVLIPANPSIISGWEGEVMYMYDLGYHLDFEVFQIFLFLVENDFQSKQKYSTSQLMAVLRICASDKLGAPMVKTYVKRLLCRIWTFSLEEISLGRLSLDAPEALMAARWNHLPQVKKRAIFELIRSPDALDDILQSKYPRDWFLNDADIHRLWQCREGLKGPWRDFVSVPPLALYETCPTYGAASPCSAARKRLAADWAAIIGEPMVEGDYQYDPLGGMHELCRTNWRSFGLCLGCVRWIGRLCEEKKVEWYGRFDQWIHPEVWCLDDGEVELDEEGNMPYVDSDDEGGGEEVDELEDDDSEAVVATAGASDT